MALVQRLLDVSCAGLPLMYRTDKQTFAHTRRQDRLEGTRVDGVSLRYGAIVLLGARLLDEESQRKIFGGELAIDFCSRLIADLKCVDSLGDAALAAWAAAEMKHPDLGVTLGHLARLANTSSNLFTVDAAWALSALVAARHQFDTAKEARSLCTRLTRGFGTDAGVFPHWIDPTPATWYRAHLACFADQVYPIQALARYHGAFQDPVALEIADSCAAQICDLQGEAGQWWWHYDVRTGEVIEGYPVYSVHQDAMGPMALLDLLDSGGSDHGDAVRKSLRWMECAPEVQRSLIEDDLSLIWRKVTRAEPGKLVRGVQATASLFHRDLRLSWLNRLFPPTTIDYESRPYHLGWILYTWLEQH